MTIQSLTTLRTSVNEKPLLDSACSNAFHCNLHLQQHPSSLTNRLLEICIGGSVEKETERAQPKQEV